MLPDYEKKAKRKLEENVYDNRGMRMAYYAHKMAPSTTIRIEDMKLNGINFTNDQFFFIAFAQLKSEFEVEIQIIVSLIKKIVFINRQSATWMKAQLLSTPHPVTESISLWQTSLNLA
jgi:hypothetical protein